MSRRHTAAPRLWRTAAAAAAAIAAVAGVQEALARESADAADLRVQVQYAPQEQAGTSKTVPVGVPARFDVYVGTVGAEPAANVVVTVAFSSPVRILAADSACERVLPIVCKLQTVTETSSYLRLSVASDTPGALVLTATVRGDQTDPNPGNNEFSQTIEVLAAGGSSGGGSSAALRVSRFARTPAAPRAGRRLTATLTVAGSALPTAGKVTCTATVRGTRLRPIVRRYRAGAATCAWNVPPNAKGARLIGSMALAAGGRTLSRRFSATVR